MDTNEPPQAGLDAVSALDQLAEMLMWTAASAEELSGEQEAVALLGQAAALMMRSEASTVAAARSMEELELRFVYLLDGLETLIAAMSCPPEDAHMLKEKLRLLRERADRTRPSVNRD